MPAMVIIEVDPGFKAETPDDKEQLALAKRMGPKEVEYQTALENVVNSRGLYRIKPDSATIPVDPVPSAFPGGRLEDKSNEDLKLMLVNLGIRTEKQMKRSDIIRLISTKLEAIEIVPEDDLSPDEDAVAAEAEAARIASEKVAATEAARAKAEADAAKQLAEQAAKKTAAKKD